jgi:protein involved in polysaccharide export with SLBB domain
VPEPPGDRVLSTIKNLDQWIPAVLPRDSYRIGAGDTLGIYVRGKSSLKYLVRPDAVPPGNANEVTVSLSGEINLPLAGKITAAGRTVTELENAIRTELSKYIRQFEVSVSISAVRTVNVWVSGEVENPGPQVLPAVCTASLAALQAGIKPTGSTRRITLTRDGKQRTVDLYRMTITGLIDADIPLEPGDSIHVPPVTDYVEVKGEVTRPGRYEMAAFDAGGFGVQDLLRLSLGTTPAAALDRASIERIDSDGRKSAITADLRDGSESIPLQPGDVLVVPSIEAFQPMLRLIGEFKGEGVYQRTPGTTEIDVENKSGIYLLKRGQTVLDVISATGGVTPQADLKRARIERKEDGKIRSIPIDLESLLVRNDKSADVLLVSGDSLILPALADKIHVFGEVKSPGSYVYSPRRKLVDYLGDAGGPTERAKLTDVSVVRGSLELPEITRLNVDLAIRGSSTKGNPELEPGDIVFVPQKFISNWREGMQLLFSSLSLASLLSK